MNGKNICDTCRHYKKILLVSELNGTQTLYGYCNATDNYKRQQPEDTCDRWTEQKKGKR